VTSMFLRLSTTPAVLIMLFSVVSVFVLLRGHHAPGGGFAGGLLLAAAIAIQLLARGAAEARRVLVFDPRTLVGVGLALASLSACLGLVAGRSLLAPLWGPELPSLGRIGTVLAFDLGVYLIVAGTALTIIFALVEEP
jgi:multicomponent Na+:H+ antiporter subunit B